MTKDDAGFTLIELIITVAMSTIVVSVLAASLLVGLRTTDDTQTRLAESHDAQLAAAYFVGDVQGSDYVSLAGMGCVLDGETSLIAVEWNDGDSISTAAYYVHSQAGEKRLSRRLCVNDTTTGSTQTSVLTISHNLSSAVDPSVTCEPACPGSGTVTPANVGMTVTDESGYSFSVSASRRVG